MKKTYKKISICLVALVVYQSTSAQCSSPSNLGQTSNMFGVILNGSHPVAVDKDLNTVVYLHRQDIAQFAGNSGQLRYSLSTNAGVTWTNNLGLVNPNANADLARYPNVVIHNPPSNTNPMNAYLAHFCPTTNGTLWTGVVSGVNKLDGTVITENYNQPGVTTGQIPRSLVKGAAGIYWAIDPIIPTGTTGYLIYKGLWNSSINDVQWLTTFTINPPFNTSYASIAMVGDYNIAFDPTGMTGWMSFVGHVSPGPTNYAYYPVLYKTIDGGNTWTGPHQVDLTQLSCITSNISGGNFPSINIEHDLVVDVNGNPHFITTVGNAFNYTFNYSSWHHMYDFTLKDGLWVGYDLGNVLGGQAVITSTGGNAVQTQAPQAARTADGTKVFFTWTDNSSYSLGATNSSPNLFAKALDVTTGMWTPVKDFTSCNAQTAGLILFPHLAHEVLEPSANVYKLASVYSDFTVPGDLLVSVKNIFLDNTTFAASEFSIATPPATVTINQGPNLLYCPNTTVNVTVNGAGQAIWNNSITTTTLALFNPTVTTYSVIAQVGCLVGTSSITISNLSVNPVAITPSVCPGQAASFSVSGNAYNYSWTPGNVSGTNVLVVPTSTLVNLLATGDGCVGTYTVGVTIMPTPTVTIAGNNTICLGSAVTLTANGASNYLWSESTPNAVMTDTPAANTSYSVIGTAANTCTGSASVNVFIKPLPNIIANITSTAVCAGQSVTLTALGAVSYSWDGVPGTNSHAASPTANTTFTVSGTGTNQCDNSKTVAVIVHPLPSLTITPGRPSFCKGEKISLTAGGASSYTWVTGGSLTASVLVQPTVTTTYSILGMSDENCVNSLTYTLNVSQCVGVADFSMETGFQLYPNPSDGEVNLSAAVPLQVHIFNELGEEVGRIDLNEENNFKANVRGLSAGIYFISGESAGSGARIQKKLIVEK